jgi:ribosomal protein S8
MVQTSLSESVGRTTIEAMKLGVPVVLSDIPGHREAIELGGGVLYKSGDTDDLASVLSDVIKNREKYKQNAQKIKKKVLKNMSEVACNEGFVKAIEEVELTDNTQKRHRYIMDYLQTYVGVKEEQTNRLVEEVDQLRTSTDQLREGMGSLRSEVNDIRLSKAYRLGRAQADTFKKIKSVFVGKSGGKND